MELTARKGLEAVLEMFYDGQNTAREHAADPEMPETMRWYWRGRHDGEELAVHAVMRVLDMLDEQCSPVA
jgi:hypothetical protein